MNESRKQTLAKLLGQEMPLFYDGCEEVYLKGARMEDGRFFCAIFNLGYDRIQSIALSICFDTATVQVLLPDGTYAACPFTQTEHGICVEATAYPLDPVILILTPWA